MLASALLGTVRSGGDAEALLDVAAAHALRRRAGVALVHGAYPLPPAPVDDALPVGPSSAARADALLALDSATRDALPVRDMAARLELLTEWLTAAAAAGRRLPPELVPALLDAGRRHRGLRPLIPEVGGPLAGLLAAQRADWSYASSTPQVASTVGNDAAWELGTIRQRTAYLSRLRRLDPARARDVLEKGWEAEPPDDRVALLGALATGLSADDEPLLERALDDRRKQVRDVALELLARLPDSAYARRMSDRATTCIQMRGTRAITVSPPTACDRSMRRDGIAPRPPTGTGARAWWLEEILARTSLQAWPEPRAFLARQVSEEWIKTVRRGLARAAATQCDGEWAAALVDPLSADMTSDWQPADRLLLEALYDVLPAEDLAVRAAAALRHGLARATAVGVEHVLALCPRPWPPAVAEGVFGALEDQYNRRAGGWRAAGLCELAALRLPADLEPRAVALAARLRAASPNDPGVAIVDRLTTTLRFRQDMLEELA
ncbi:MAG TPA: DUF5691 domain-containing protein [Micromonosporaceae bacterium]